MHIFYTNLKHSNDARNMNTIIKPKRRNHKVYSVKNFTKIIIWFTETKKNILNFLTNYAWIMFIVIFPVKPIKICQNQMNRDEDCDDI